MVTNLLVRFDEGLHKLGWRHPYLICDWVDRFYLSGKCVADECHMGCYTENTFYASSEAFLQGLGDV